MARAGHFALLFCLVGVCVLEASAQRRADAATSGEQTNGTHALSESCMGCICEAVSSCDRGRGCAEGVCGLFALTRPYWSDAGKPVIAGDAAKRAKAFDRCAVDPFCAAATVHAYMKRYAKDCDGDGEVQCLDLAAIHVMGAEGCDAGLDAEFRRKLNKCLRLHAPT